MATGMIKNNSIFGLITESTEGTYLAPAAATDYLQVLDGVEIKPAREVVDRNLLTSSPGKETPKMGMKSVQATIPVEFRASGTEGADVDPGLLFKGALGTSRSAGTTTTTKSSPAHTSTVLQIEDADISKFAVGDMVVVKRSGLHEMRPISAVVTTGGAATITFPFALTNGAPPASVVLSKFFTYFTAATGHPALSFSAYWADTMREAAIGSKVSAMGLQNFSTGGRASWSFQLEGLTFSMTDGAAPHTPSYDSGTPPIILSACVWRAGVLTAVNNLGLNLTNKLGFTTSTCSANGKNSSRVVEREITGSFNPYKDDTTTTYFDDWVAGTEFSIFAYAYNPSATTGEFTMGSVVGIWLPQCVAVSFQSQELDGIMIDAIEWRATRGSVGTSEEMYLGFV